MRKSATAFSWGEVAFSIGVTPRQNETNLQTKFGLLAEPIAICLTDRESFDMASPVFSDVGMNAVQKLDVNEFKAAIESTSSYQPIVVFVDSSRLKDLPIESICNMLSSHLSYSIVVLRKFTPPGQRNRRPHPSLPIEFMLAPIKPDELRSKLDQFLIQASHLADYLMKMKRLEKLDEREKVLVQLISYGMPNKKSASVLGLAEKTVEKCRSGIYRKLGVRSTGELASLITMSTFYRWPLGVDFPSRNVS